MSHFDKEIDVLVENGIDKDAALAALQVYGSAEKVLLAHVCGETSDDLPRDDLVAEDNIGKRFDNLIKATQVLSWTGVDLRGEQSAELSETVAGLGANFLRQTCLKPDSVTATSSSSRSRGLDNRDERTNDILVMQIMELGFSKDSAWTALVEADYNLDQAIALLLDASY
jgi:hypothetical protein